MRTQGAGRRTAIASAQGFALGLAVGCSTPKGDGPAGTRETDTALHSGGTESASDAYNRACVEHLGELPAWEVASETREVPVTVDGVPLAVADWTPDATCDRPDLLRRTCMPGSRVGRKWGRESGGTEDMDVVWVVTLRQALPDPTLQAGWYDDVAMIGHRRSTGATCFFQSFPTGRVAELPAPDSGTSHGGWVSPETVAAADCVRCHGADPWLHSPWIDQLRDLADPAHPYVPSGADRHGRYWVVGEALADWNTRLGHITPTGNGCVSCHRIGLRESCERLVPYATGRGAGLPLSAWGSTFPSSHWMPPTTLPDAAAWTDTWQADVTVLMDCCRSPEQAHCGWAAVPGLP